VSIPAHSMARMIQSEGTYEMKRRVLHVINNLKMGGAESLLYYMLTYLQNQLYYDHDVAVLFEEGPFATALKRQGISVIRLGSRPHGNPWAFFRLVVHLRSNDYDLVHVQLFPAGLMMAFTSMLFPHIPTIYTEHNVWNRRRGSTFWKLVDRFTYSRYRRVLAVSDQVGRALTEWIPSVESRLAVLPNAVALSRFGHCAGDEPQRLRSELEIATTTKILLFAGRLARAKGIDVLLDALSVLEGNHVLLIAGVGPLQDELSAKARRVGVERRVRFLGFREDIPRLLRLTDVFVLPSRWEGTPIAILEAMAAQKPIVASAVGGITEVIRDGREGLLVPVEDAKAIARAVKTLLNDADLANQLALNAKQRVTECYSVPVMSNRLLKIYESVLQQS
jgi:glycosyltransferase involved in cell wall biosynthesis